MLELRPNCECCGALLSADSTAAWICSFECTFCEPCTAGVLDRCCPNCGGELLLRPRRPAEHLARHPASTERKVKDAGCAPRRA